MPAMANPRLAAPLPYLDFVLLMANARCVLTDSGGIQDETTALGVPCLTLRANTERPDVRRTRRSLTRRGLGPV
jgi:UDP-N-acetylglucosamine 2-epimerase (non-hydrolysing)